MNYYTVSEDTWIPAAENGAGTISCSGTIVTGSGTFFTIQVEGGDWITNSGEARQVRTVNSDTDLELYKPFSSDFSGQAISIIKEDNAKNLFLGIKNKSGADITVDGESVPDGDSVVKGEPNAPGYRRKFVEPVYVETTGTVLVNKQSITNRMVNATVPPSPIPAIYGLQFDGISNYLENPNSSALSDFYTEFIVSDVDVTAVRRALWTQNNDFLGFYYDATRYLFYRSGTNVFPYSSYSASNIPPLSGLNTLRLTRQGSNAEISANGEAVSVSPVNTTSVFVTTIGANPTGSISPFKGVLVEYSDSTGNTYNDANNWGGGTINGAIRVKSTDGGATWTTA